MDGRGFTTGDHVVTTRNDRRAGVVNGTRARITAIDATTQEVMIMVSGGGETKLPATYVQDGHIEHGYATTVHRAQGATVDRTFVLGTDDLYREWGYTALTRHRESATFYVNLGDAQTMIPGLERDDVARGPGEILGTLGHSQAKAMARERGVPIPGAERSPDSSRMEPIRIDSGR